MSIACNWKDTWTKDVDIIIIVCIVIPFTFQNNEL